MTDYRRLRVALLGAGAVGSQVARLLLEHGEELADRAGASLELAGIAVRDLDAPRDVDLPRELFTTDPEPLIVGSDIVIELMGGIEPARSLILHAINSGADVVTANKALLATHGPEIFDAADQVGASVYYEAAVAGAIPIIRPLRDSLAGDRVHRIMGIVNGTTNYVLDQMASTGMSFDDAVKQAQDLGYAEADPTADVEGFDAAAKAAILASLAFHTRVSLEDVAREGITRITADDVAWAAQTGHAIKLLAIAESVTGDDGTQGVSVRVHPALVPLAHPLAGVRGAFNAVFVEADAAGELMFYGRGAGGSPTASAVLGDVVSAARHRVLGGKGPEESIYAALPILPASNAITRYQVRLAVDDRPGVLAQVAQVLASQGVSIEAVRQPSEAPAPGAEAGQDEGSAGVAHLVITTHAAAEAALAATVAAIAVLEPVREITSVLRVEGA